MVLLLDPGKGVLCVPLECLLLYAWREQGEERGEADIELHLNSLLQEREYLLPISALLASRAGATLPASEHSMAAIWKIC